MAKRHADKAPEEQRQQVILLHRSITIDLARPVSNRKGKSDMDKKSKKRLDVINKKLQTLRPRLAGSREQADDPSELKQLEDEIKNLEAESAQLKAKK